MDILDRPPGEPERASPVVYQQAFQNYFEGLVLRDPAQLREAANQLEYSGLPLAANIHIDTYKLEEILSSVTDQAVADKLVGKAFLQAMRSYVYSGLAVNAGALLSTATLLGKDKDWLRRNLEPHTGALRTIFDNLQLTQEELRQRRDYGLVVMRRLGVISRFSAFLMRH